eukprot:scaffold18928_cov69-Phaeocystis_antarctica.AAC.6
MGESTTTSFATGSALLCGGSASVGAEPALGRSSKLYNVLGPATMNHCVVLATWEQEIVLAASSASTTPACPLATASTRGVALSFASESVDATSSEGDTSPPQGPTRGIAPSSSASEGAAPASSALSWRA